MLVLLPYQELAMLQEEEREELERATQKMTQLVYFHNDHNDDLKL